VPARRKARNTKPKTITKLKQYHVEVGGRSNAVVADFGTPAQQRGTADRVRWSFVGEAPCKKRALDHIDEFIAGIGKLVSAAADRERCLNDLASARVDIDNMEIVAEPREWRIQLDSYYDTWLVVRLYKEDRYG